MKTVYSSEHGKMCPGCGYPEKQCRCSKQSPSTHDPTKPVKVRRETKGRKGKGVTLIENLPLEQTELKAAAKKLKQLCGSGGTLKGNVIEIQGDHREKIAKWVKQQGWPIKKA